jgi:ribosomal protein L37AE/L43A
METKPLYCTRCGKIQLHVRTEKGFFKCAKCGKEIKNNPNDKLQVLKLK